MIQSKWIADISKTKTHIIELPCIHERYFTHICKARGLINEFSIFAKVITEDEKTVTIDRFQKIRLIAYRNYYYFTRRF